MATLVALTPEPPSGNVVALLENLLTMARAGEISSLAVAGVRRDGSALTEWTYQPSVPALLGAVSRLQHRLNLNAD